MFFGFHFFSLKHHHIEPELQLPKALVVTVVDESKNFLHTTPKHNHAPTSALEDVYEKINTGMKERFKMDDQETDDDEEKQDFKHRDDKFTR